MVLLLVVGLLACTPDTGTQPAPMSSVSTPAPAGVAPPGALATPGADAPVPGEDRLQPLTRLGPCSSAPPQGRDDDVRGLVLPDDGVLTQVSPAEPLTNVQGYVPMTPVQIRAFYQQHPALTVISVEDEVFEAEVLYEVDDRRVFVKSQAVCDLGSVFVAVVGPSTP